MTANQISALMVVAAALGGCVAPEATPPARANAAQTTQPVSSSATFEDAPLPNRKLGAPTGDSIIRLAH